MTDDIQETMTDAEYEDTYGFTPPAQNAWSISGIVSSKQFQPIRCIIYGVPGIGKTTFAATWDAPILLRTEDGAAALDIPTFPDLCQSLDDFRRAYRALRTEEHQFKTLIIDSLDWLEPLVQGEVCRERNVSSIEDLPYGRGYVMADAKWRAIQDALTELMDIKQMHIVCVAHASTEKFESPDSPPYNRYSIKMHKRAAARWMEWARMILFINYRKEIISDDAPTRGKKQASLLPVKSRAVGEGNRVIYTQERPAYQAKSLWTLPAEINIGADRTWGAFHRALNKATEGIYKGAK